MHICNNRHSTAPETLKVLAGVQNVYYNRVDSPSSSIVSGLELRAIIENVPLIKTDTYMLYCYPVTKVVNSG